jgi:tRNA-specific 2-thiouridylase
MSGKKETVVVAMSGGVDSSVSAALLVKQGYEVTGMMMRLWSEPGQATQRDNRCCTRDQMMDAHLVAKKLGIPFRIIDVTETFKRTIVDFFVEGYRQGITPNPCLECNREIRFTFLLNQALATGAKYLATGHYARITHAEDGTFELRKGIDPNKDQSYVLSVLDQHQLSHAMFPVGEITKTQVREVARRYGLRVANKSDSQDLCFVADGNYRRFMRDVAPDAFHSGPIVTRSGQVLGDHDGLPNYTIGQRKGLGIASPEPLYVVAKDVQTNTLVVAGREDPGSSCFEVRQMHWVAGSAPSGSSPIDVKIRYKAIPVRALIERVDSDTAHIRLEEPLHDITPGQGAVIYRGDLVLGSGIISKTEG